MARFLFTVWPFPGHYFPTVAIAHALRRRGHEVAFYTGAAAGQVIGDEGFRCFPFSALDEQQLNDVLFSPANHTAVPVKRLRYRKRMHRAWLLETIPQQLADLAAVLAEWQPDVIMCDASMWGPILVLHETRALPVAVFSTTIGCMLPGIDTPPFGLGVPPPHNWSTRVLTRFFKAIADRLAADFKQAANAIRTDYRLPPLTKSVTEFTGHMPLYVMPSIPEFDYQRCDLPRSVQYVGPCLWNSSSCESPPLWLAQLSHDRPLIHVSEGTVHAQQPLVLRAAAQGLANMPAHVILTTGGNRDPATLDLGPLAANIQVERWVAHSDLLPQTAVLVTTGGAGTVMAALAAGVPLVIIPTEWDKPENAQRVVQAGAGLRLAPRRCTPARLRAAVECVLREPSFHQNAQRLAATLARYNGPTRAAQLLEQLSNGAMEGGLL